MGSPPPSTRTIAARSRRLQSSVSASTARAGAARGFPPDYDGDYFFADYSQGFLRRIKQSGATWALAPASGQPNAQDWGTGYAAVTDALEGANGELYYLRQSPLGELRRIYYDYGALDAEPAALRGVRFVAGTPSPAHGAARFELSLDVDRDVELTVLDADGRRAATVLPAMRMNAGRHELRWDGRIAGRIAPSGVYFARLRVGSQALTRRFVWLR